MIHFGVLATCALPDADSVYTDRALILALEATFTYGFWTIISINDYNVPLFQPSNVKQLEYKGLNKHTALAGGILEGLIP